MLMTMLLQYTKFYFFFIKECGYNMSFVTLKEPCDVAPTFKMSLPQEMKIFADHYGYDYATCQVKNNAGRIVSTGYCLVNPDDGNVIDDVPNWRYDDELLEKLYEFEKMIGFIDSNVSLSDFIVDARF